MDVGKGRFVVLSVFWAVRGGMPTGWSCRRWMIRIKEFGAGLSWDTSLMRRRTGNLGLRSSQVCVCSGL